MERKHEVPREVQLHGLRLATDPARAYGREDIEKNNHKIIENEQEDEPRD